MSFRVISGAEKAAVEDRPDRGLHWGPDRRSNDSGHVGALQNVHKPGRIPTESETGQRWSATNGKRLHHRMRIRGQNAENEIYGIEAHRGSRSFAKRQENAQRLEKIVASERN